MHLFVSISTLQNRLQTTKRVSIGRVVVCFYRAFRGIHKMSIFTQIIL